jgi:hypothetical protein
MKRDERIWLEDPTGQALAGALAYISARTKRRPFEGRFVEAPKVWPKLLSKVVTDVNLRFVQMSGGFAYVVRK